MWTKIEKKVFKMKILERFYNNKQHIYWTKRKEQMFVLRYTFSVFYDIMSARESERACPLLTNGEIIEWWNHDIMSKSEIGREKLSHNERRMSNTINFEAIVRYKKQSCYKEIINTIFQLNMRLKIVDWKLKLEIGQKVFKINVNSLTIKFFDFQILYYTKMESWDWWDKLRVKNNFEIVQEVPVGKQRRGM